MTQIESSSMLIAKLRAVLFRQRLVLTAAGIVTTLSAMLAIWILMSFLANIVVLPVWFKISLLILAGGVTAYLFGRFALGRLFEGSVDQVALALEMKHPDLKGRLIAAIQFVRMGSNPGYSAELIEVTEHQAIREAGLLNLNEVVSFHPVLATSRFLAVAAAVGILLLVLTPGFFSRSFEVFSNPTTEIAPPVGYSLTPIPGSCEWTKYQDLTIGAAVVGFRLPDKAVINYRLADGSWQKMPVDMKSTRHLTGSSGDSVTATMTLRQVNKSLEYFVEAGRLKTGTFQVTVVDRPRVTNITLSIFYPAYTGLPPSTVSENNGSFSAVVGSRATLKVESSLPVEKAEMVYDDSSRVPLTLRGKAGEASLVVEKSQSYHIALVDHLGKSNPDPIQYYVTAVPDEYPVVDVLYPGFDANLTDEMILPLKVHISDDYGFSSLVMKYAITTHTGKSDEHVAVINYSDQIKTEGDVEFKWNMDQLNMFPGDYVQYYFEVADNDRISGPKISRSRQYIARIPSLEEIVAQTESEGKERISATENLLQSGKDLVQRMKNAARKLQAQNQQSNKSDWQQQKELEAIAQKNSEMVNQVEKLAQRMDSSLNNLKEDALLSREVLEKMQQIQKLFEEVATPEMREAQKKLMEALRNMDKQQLQDAMKNFEMSQKELLERLERTLALLKKLQVEQKMEAMVRQAEQLVQRQDANNKSTESSKSEQLPQLSKSEDQVKDAMDKLQQDVQELQQLMKEAQMEQVPEAQKFAEAVQKNDAAQNMSSMSQSLKQQQQQSAMKEGKNASDKLNSMLGEMQKQQMAMRGADNEAMKRAMKRAVEDANQLSKNQEELLKQAASLDPSSIVMRDMAVNQQDLASACQGLNNSISDIGKQSPFVAAELRSLLQNTTQNMQQAIDNFEGRRGAPAIDQQRQAMSGLNRASMRLLESMEKQNQCQKAGQCSNPMQQLESMCNKQNQLNQQTQSQCPNPGTKPGQSNREQLQRLAGEQGSIRKSMEQLEQEFGDSRQILGRLSDIAKEMKEVEEDLSNGTVGDETTARQLRVYSRMLEASRSLQRKDFTDQRKATTASQQPVFVPPSLTSDLLNDRAHFEDRLKQFLGDNYPPQYEEQIKAYFRALLQSESPSAAPASTGEAQP
jgi:hypothetical protein